MMVKRGKRVQTAGQSRAKKPQGRAERRINRLMLQLIVSAAVFLLVFVGGGLIPDQVCDVFAAVHQVISGDNSLLESVETLGSAVGEGEDWRTAVRDWCVDTFLPGPLREKEPEEPFDFLSVSARFHHHLLPEGPYAQDGDPLEAPLN